jgi:hypothetical protein
MSRDIEQGAFQFIPFDLRAELRYVHATWFPHIRRNPSVRWAHGFGPLACIRAPERWTFASITLNRALDRPDTPIEVLHYLLKHEFLHIEVPPVGRGPRAISHPQEFWDREAELCPEREACWRWLHENLGHCLCDIPRLEGTFVAPNRIPGARRRLPRASSRR